MTQTNEATELNFRANYDYDQERIDIETHYLALVDSGKYTPSMIYEYILMQNDTLEYPLSAEDLSNYSDSLFKEETPSQDAQEVDALTTYRQSIAEKDTKKLYQCIENLALLKRLSPIKYALTKEEINKAFGKDINWRDLNSAITFAERKQALAETGTKPDVADIAQRWAMTYSDTWRYDETTLCWRRWNDEYWEEVEEKGSILDQYTIAAMQEAAIPVNSTSTMNTFLRVAQSYCKHKFIPVQDKINFANGTLDINTGKLTGYDKEDKLTYCLPYYHNPQKKHPNITTFLLSVMQEKYIDKDTQVMTYIPNVYGVQALMAHIGLALIGDITLHKAIVVLGAPGSGKSTVLDFINALCGILPGNYVPHDVFSRELEGKRSRYIHNKRRAACIDEVPADALQEEETFKLMTAHKGVSMRGMHKNEQVDNQWKPKIFMVANEDPHYKDISGAIKRRLIVIRTPIQRYNEPKDGQPGQNATLLESLLLELEGFVVTCLQYALEVRKRGYYPQSAIMKCDLDQIASNGNPLKAFIEDKLILDSMAHELTSVLHNAYVEYCQGLGHNIQPLARPKFSSALCGMNIGVAPKKLRDERALFGIRLRNGQDPKPTDEGDETKYQDSPLLETKDSTMDGILDSYQSCGIVDFRSRPISESTPQANVQS